MHRQQILIPLDMSETAEAALPVARLLAATMDATLNLLGVSADVEPAATRELWDYLAQLAAEQRRSGQQVCTRLRIGDPASSILMLEHELKIDLIVMATRGRTGLRRMLLGSVADKVAHESTAPVVLLRPGERPIPQCLRTVMVPLDDTPSSALALGMAIPLVRAAHASMVVMQASGSDRQAAQTRADAIAGRVRRAGLCAQGVGVCGKPGASIISAADEIDADLIVMRTRGRRGPVRSVLGSVANEVVRTSQRPVLLVKSKAAS